MRSSLLCIFSKGSKRKTYEGSIIWEVVRNSFYGRKSVYLSQNGFAVAENLNKLDSNFLSFFVQFLCALSLREQRSVRLLLLLLLLLLHSIQDTGSSDLCFVRCIFPLDYKKEKRDDFMWLIKLNPLSFFLPQLTCEITLINPSFILLSLFY